MVMTRRRAQGMMSCSTPSPTPSDQGLHSYAGIYAGGATILLLCCDSVRSSLVSRVCASVFTACLF
jgi:hypothetical protein